MNVLEKRKKHSPGIIWKAVLCLLSVLCPLTVEAQQLGVRSNMLWWATTTPNIGLEVAAGQHYSVEVITGYNAWSFGRESMSLRHWIVQPEVRYWPCKVFEGHFFGLHGHYGKYNVGQISFLPDLDTYTYRGKLYGGGISYGYHFAIGGRWGLELSAGLGYTYLEYDKYLCRECAEPMGLFRRHYWGPTRLGISFIYLIR